MTKITIYENNGIYTGFESVGHADYEGGEEYDIVCAAISILTQGLYFSLVENCELDEDEIYAKQRDGFLEIKLDYDKSSNIKVQSNFEFMITGLKLLEAQYSNYINLEKMEVQR